MPSEDGLRQLPKVSAFNNGEYKSTQTKVILTIFGFSFSIYCCSRSHCSDNQNDSDNDTKRTHSSGLMSVCVFCAEQFNQQNALSLRRDRYSSRQRSVTRPLRPGPNFMALLTISKESALTEAGNSVLSVFHGVSGKFWLLRVRTHRYQAVYAYKASAELRCLHVSRES